MAKRESIGNRLHRLRRERGLSQRDISSAGVSYAYISRIEAGARTPSVKAIRLLAEKLGISVEYLETGSASPVERGVIDAGVDFGSLTRAELRTVQTAADEAAREGARTASEQVKAQRDKAEAANLRKRLRELEGR